MKTIRPTGLRAAMVVLAATAPVAAAPAPGPDTAAGEQALRIAAEFSSLAADELRWGGLDPRWVGRRVGLVTCESVEVAGRFMVDLDLGAVISFHHRGDAGLLELFLPGQKPAPVPKASDAESILRRWFARLPVLEGVEWVLTVRPWRDGLDTPKCIWYAKVDGILLGGCTASMCLNSSTGGLLSSFFVPPQLGTMPEPAKLGREEAVLIARGHCTLDPGFMLGEVELEAQVYVPPDRREPGQPPGPIEPEVHRFYYVVAWDGLEPLPDDAARRRLFGFPATRRAVRQTVIVDALDGSVDPRQTFLRPTPNEDWRAIARRVNPHLATERLRRCLLEDRAPTLARDGTLLWTTSRGGPFERRTSSLALRRPNAPIQLVIRDIPTWAPVFPSISPAGDKLAYSHQGIVHELDLMTGEQRQHTRADRPGSAPVFHPNGLWLAVEGVRSTYDQDVYLFDTARSLTDVDGQRRIIRLEGIEALPAFRPDGRQVVFAHHPPDDPLGPWELWAAELTDTFGEVQNVQRVVGELPEPGVLTWSPDGTWLLWSRQQTPDCELPAWFRIDVQAGTKAEIPVPTLPDPELAGRNLAPFDPVLAAPDEVIVAAIHWSGKADEAGFWLLYRCRLDGTGLRRLTPRNDVFEVYRFPAGAAEVPVAGEPR